MLALGHLHDNGFTHRNINIKNILFENDGYVVLTGFNHAKRFDKFSKLRFVVEDCHENYAPEMIAGDSQDHTVDWWMLGILMYRMLVGVSPFHELNEEDIPHSIIQKEVEFPDEDEFSIKVSEVAKDLILRLLNKDISSRLGANGH